MLRSEIESILLVENEFEELFIWFKVKCKKDDKNQIFEFISSVERDNRHESVNQCYYLALFLKHLNRNKLTLCIQQQENKFRFCGRNCFWKKEIFTFLWVFLHFCEKWFLNPWFINPNLFSSSKEKANISFVIFTKIESSVSFSTCLHRATVFTRHMKKIHFIHSCFSEEEWKVHRRLVSPTMNQLSVSSHLPIFNKNIRQIVSSLPTNSDFFDILPSMTTCTLTMFAEAALGTEWEPEAKQRYLQQMAAYVSRN